MKQPQAPILTVTLNPALDISTATQVVHAGPKLRCDVPRFDPGGGGINISRAIAALGGQSNALVASGGSTGVHLLQLLQKEGIDVTPLAAPGETRQSLSVTDQTTGGQFRFVMPGPDWPSAQTEAALGAIIAAAGGVGFVVISGSQPPGFASNFIALLCAALPPRIQLVADTSGSPLEYVVGRSGLGLCVLRMDAEEAEMMAGSSLPDRKDSARFAQSLVQRGIADRVIIARGADGSVMATARGQWFCQAAKVPVKSKVGAGDSFVAGFVLALARGGSEPEALSFGVAAASAAVMTPATELCRGTDTEALVPLCPVSAL